VRFSFIETEKACFPVTLMCRMLAVSRAGFYAWRRRPAAARTRQELIFPGLAYVQLPAPFDCIVVAVVSTLPSSIAMRE
jgi:hypothetical protein